MNRNDYLEPSKDKVDGGNAVGKHPKTVGIDALKKLPTKHSPIKAIRQKCLDCTVYQESEVRKCIAYDCPLWPFRMGVNPFHGRV